MIADVSSDTQIPFYEDHYVNANMKQKCMECAKGNITILDVINCLKNFDGISKNGMKYIPYNAIKKLV